MAYENKKWISIMIVPEDGTFMRKWRITAKRYRFLKISLWFVGFFLILGFSAMITIGVMYGKMKHYNTLNKQLSEAAKKLEIITARLDSYEEKEKKLRTVLGSDLDLPKPLTEEIVETATSKTVAGSSVSTDEFEKAILDQEAKTRRIPTMWPVDGWQISKGFISSISNKGKDHLGIDILAPQKSSVVASADGVVTFAGMDDSYGNLIVIDHGNGWETKYGHNKILLVEYGKNVRKGQQIAVYGGTDKSSTGTHLHFSVSYKGKPVDPLTVLEKKPKLQIIGNKK